MKRSLLAVVLPVLLASSACATHLPDTLKKIQSTGTMTVGYREASIPFSFLDRDEKPTGYSVELCKRIAAAVQQDLGLVVIGEVVDVEERRAGDGGAVPGREAFEHPL